MTVRTGNSKRVAFNGILLALLVITMYLASLLPGLKTSLLTLSSFYIALVIIEFNILNGWIFYLASSLLLLIVLPNKLMLIPYVLFFGVYGIVKFYIERRNKIVVEYILKILYFNIFFIPLIFFGGKLFFSNAIDKFPMWAVITALEVVFIVYDYIYTLFIRYYIQKVKSKIKI
ncbi:MAG: hypothetical protein WC677_03020 [Clostridia bacterium]|jgi:hypothetical protein